MPTYFKKSIDVWYKFNTWQQKYHFKDLEHKKNWNELKVEKGKKEEDLNKWFIIIYKLILN